MTLLFILLPVLVVAGAFMWLKPSPRDQFLTKLRSEAIGAGFRMGSLSVPETSVYGRVKGQRVMVTLYQRSLHLDDTKQQRFVVQRTTGDHGAFLPEGWSWVDRTAMETQDYQRLGDFLEKLPPSVSLVGLSADAASLSWDERDPDIELEHLKAWLVSLAKQFHRTAI